MRRMATLGTLALVAALVTALATTLGCTGGGGSPDPDTPPAKDECVEDTDCDDAVPCTEDVCGASVGGVSRCTHLPRSERCGAGEECAIGTSAATSGCKPIAQGPCKGKADGAECDPGDKCATAKGFCNAGKCTAPLKPCPPENCRLSLGCDKATGECAYDVATDGTACDGPSLCAPRCAGGQCAGSPISCDDANACTADVCDPEAGCTHSGGDCDDQNACTTDTCDKATGCSHTGGTCDDGDACTKDSCDPASGCQHAGVDCDDQNACTTDTCDKLTGCGNAYACDDGNACTTDSCDKAVGCGHAYLTCWDGDSCTIDSCDPGKGCVFPEIHPCCGDALVEGPETCDPGDEGTDLCGDTCESVTLLLEEEGRAPAAAGNADGGAVAWERVGYGKMGVRVRLVDGQGRLGQIHNIEGPSWAPEAGGPRPALAPLLPGTFLLGAFVRMEYPDDAFAVKLTPLTEEGAVVQEPVHVPLAGKPGSGIFLDVAGSTGILAWGEGNTGGNDQDALWARFSLGGTKATPGPATRVLPEGRRSLPGGACAGPEAHVVVWVEDAGMDIVDSVTRLLPNGDVDTYELTRFKADMPIPPRCTAAADGFLAVWGDIGEWGGNPAFRLWSRRLDAYGLPAGKAAVSIGQWDALSEYLCYPWFASVARTGTGFAVAVACATIAAGQPASMQIELWRLDPDGKPVDGTPEVVPGQQAPFAIDVASAWGPGTSSLVTWQETVSVGGSSIPWSPIRVRALGLF